MSTAHRMGLLGGLGLALVSVSAVQADWRDMLNQVLTGNSEEESVLESGAQALLSNEEIVGGLKQALNKGVKFAVDNLGAEGGFLDNPQVRIPMPENLAWADKGLRTLGQDQLADDFVASMNRAAEQAVPETLKVFRNTIKQMSLQDARAILQGPENAATEYFREQSGEQLAGRILPLVQDATTKVGVTSYYKSMVDKAEPLNTLGLFDTESLDLDQYVTDKAMDGLFLMIAEEEKRIRENPVERTTDLLKKVFGAYSGG